MGTIINMLTGLDVTSGALIGAAIVLTYTYAGGMWAVTLTDIVQILLIVAGFLIILPGVVTEAGGIAHLYSTLNSSDLTLGICGNAGAEDWVYYTGSWIVMGLGCMVGQDLIQRSLASKDEKCASRSALTAAFIYFAIALIPITVGFAARIVLPKYGITAESVGGNLENQILPQMAVIVLSKLHPVILVLFFSALISAIMSSADSCLLAGSSLFCNNVLKPFVPDMPEKRFLLITRLSTIVFVGISLFFALNIRNIYLLMKNAWVSQLVVVFLPVMAALYLPKASRKAAWAGMLTATAVWLGYCVIYSVRSRESFLALMNNFDRPLTCGAVYGFAAGIAAFFICFGIEEVLMKKFGNKGVSR
jgi:Na+/proline symporter